MITIGEQQLATTTPADLDARLVKTTGCSAAEHARMIQQRPVPFAIARALAPLVEPATPVGDLAAMIEPLDADEAITLAKEVAALLTATTAAPVIAPMGAGASG